MTERRDRGCFPVLVLSEGSLDEFRLPQMWQREYQLRAVSLSGVRRAPSESNPLLVFCGGPDELRLMPEWPEDSVRLFVDWDETFMPELIRGMATRREVAELIRNYPTQEGGWDGLLPNVVVAAREVVSTSGASVRMALRAWFAGVVVAQRKSYSRRRLRAAGVRVREITLGYTDMFVEGVNAVSRRAQWGTLEDDESLLAYLVDRADELTDLKRIDLAYVGQLGKFQRRCGIEAARAMGYSIGPVRTGYGGQGASPTEDISATYVEAMAAARFALCPPGNYAGDSFRFGEALLLGTLPVEVSRVISEPGRSHMRDIQEFTVTAPTWREALRQMSRMSESERLERVAVARTAYVSRLAEARSILRNGV